MKISINKIFRSWKDKQGNPLKTKDNREYERVAIQCKEYGSQWVSGFGGNWNLDWKTGDIVELDVEKSGQYLNFRKPDPIKALTDRVKLIEDRLENHIKESSAEEFEESEPPVEEEIDVSQIPF